MKKKKTLVKPPNIKVDQATVIKNSKRDLNESFEKPASFDHLVDLVQTLKKAKKK